ncbi:MAG: GAF domain-containing protein, partial [Anaerolineales bacterium]|nr:GAF domain-containing protein [Anaerolineales bacterium]
MMNQSTTVDFNHIHTLWQKLAYELMNTFDAHGVCAAVANEIAIYTQTTTVMGVSGPQNRYYDVWVCDKNGRIQQTRWDYDKASFAGLIRAGKAIYQEKFTQSAAELIKSELWQLPRDAILSVPIPIPGRYDPVSPPGVLCLIDPDQNCPINLNTIEPLATNITMVLDRAYLRHHVDRQDIEFAVVSEISYALTSTLSLQNIYRQLMEPVRRTLNVESISVGLIDPTSGDITFVDMLLGPLFQDLPPIRLKRGQGIAGWVAEHREPIIINDVYADKRFYSTVDQQSGFVTNSMVCIPLQVEERMIGVLQAINKKSSNFNENDLRLLQAIGGSLAAAIENSRLHADVISEKRRIETIFSSMSEGLLTINSEGYITHTNDSLLSLLFKEREALIGKLAKDMIRFKNGSLLEFTEQVLAAEVDETPQFATDILQEGGNSVPVLVSGATIKGANEEISEIIFVFSDLRLIREVERMRDDFFHGIIHELRTPLATILMYARLLREGKAQQKEKADRFLGVIERESDRLQKMVRQMLEVAKMEARELQRGDEPVDLNPIFEEMLPPLADRASEKGLVFRQRVQSDMPPVLGNKETLYLIFKNLIDNAIKFTLSGQVQVDAKLVRDKIEVSIRDEGIGIPQQALPNLFGRFFRAQTA